MSELCMSVPSMAKHFGVGEGCIYAALKRGEIPHFRLGELYRVRLSDVPARLVDRWSRDEGPCQRSDLPAGQAVYFLGGCPGYVKIGFTTELARRVAELQPGSPYRLELLAYLINGTFADEKAYHRHFHSHRAEGEWFRLCPEIDREIGRLKALYAIHSMHAADRNGWSVVINQMLAAGFAPADIRRVTAASTRAFNRWLAGADAPREATRRRLRLQFITMLESARTPATEPVVRSTAA
jgi:excisionase family DNA binding protein